MEKWQGLLPAFLRGLGLAAGALVLQAIAAGHGQPIDWHIAILYGTMLGLGMRWPIIMPVTGVRVVLIAGLILDAVWRHGILTGLALVLVDFAVRMVALYTEYRLWEWYRPLIVLGALASGWWLSEVVAAPAGNLFLGLRTDASAFLFAYSFWMVAHLVWSFIQAPVRRQPITAHYLQRVRQTWWVPLCFLAVAWLMTLVHRFGYPVEVPAVLFLLWIQALIGPIFTTMHQDRAVSEMIRLAPWQSPQRRSLSQRVMRTAYSLGRSLRLSEDELRTIAYAALLQEALLPPDAPLPLWYPFTPGPEEVALIRQYNEAVVRRIEEDGALQDVANLIRYRFATFDGKGVPPAAGDAIPMGAQVLAAANALVYLTSPEGRGLSPEEAVNWIRVHGGGRFQLELLHAMLNTLTGMGTVRETGEGLPRTIHQLQGLLGDAVADSALRLGLRRALMQLRSHAGLLPALPAAVQAVGRLSTILTNSRDSDQAAQVLVRSVGELMNAKVALALADGPRGDLNMIFRAVYGYQHLNILGRPIAVQAGYMTRALLQQEPTQLVDLQEASSPLAQEIARVEGIRSVLFVPLVSQGQPIGLLFVGLTRHHWFTPRETGLIHLMADLAATALEKTRLMAELEEQIRHISSLKAFTDILLDNLSQAIIVVDPHGNLTLANAAAHRIFGGLDRKGEPLPPGLRALFHVEEALAGESLSEYDVRWQARVLAVQASPLRDCNGALLGAVCQARDVTQVRQMEERNQRLERLAAVAELAAGAAHEIRNPLTSIRGFMQLLQVQGREGQAEYFQIMLNEIDRIDAIIRDLLLLARPYQVQRTPTDLAAVAEEVLLLRKAELERQSIAVDCRIALDGPALLDANMLRQLLLNLIINAIQAMPSGGRLTLAIWRADPGQIVLQVSDTGVGIPPENVKRIFDPFFTTKEGGTGLGLALCHSIAQAHGGHIQVDSRVGAGTTFTVTLHAPAAHG